MSVEEELKMKQERRELLHWFKENEQTNGTPAEKVYKQKALRFRKINQLLGK